ncbi:MAG: sensor histidine kinase, partial [Thermomicrobiales bacterium]
VDLAVNALDRAPSTARDELLSVRELVGDARDDVRAMMAGLRPRLLEERGLIVALRSLAAMPPLWGTEVSVDMRGIAEGTRWPPDIELALYRIAQEAVSNARRHGAASRVRVELESGSGVVMLLVADDGRGLPGGTVQSVFGRGEGLPGMRERAQLLGGDLTIDSTPGVGTRISVSLPLPRARGEAELGERSA